MTETDTKTRRTDVPISPAVAADRILHLRESMADRRAKIAEQLDEVTRLEAERERRLIARSTDPGATKAILNALTPPPTE